MKILIITGPLYPSVGNNANLIRKLVPFLSEKNEVRILSAAFGADTASLPEELFGVPVYFAVSSASDIQRRLKAKIVDRNGYSDYIGSESLKDKALEIKKEYDYDAVLATCEPFIAACAASKLPCSVKTLYIMDPPNSVCNKDKSTKFRDTEFPQILKKCTGIVTTPFIKEALIKSGFGEYSDKMTTLGFPMIENHEVSQAEEKNEKTNLLFCGWLYSDIRSPKYFLDIVSRLDESYIVTFMGKECDSLMSRFEINTKAEIVTLPQQPYDKALEAMEKADILINIGNSVPVHMPSKTLEYINTGKPFVNFYKFEACPTLYYTKRYPLCLNLYEGDTDTEGAVEKFRAFCETNKGKKVSRELVEKEFEDCTPEYIAKKILDGLVN